jgi:diguanylate cyclase (GGDEF)-like protein
MQVALRQKLEACKNLPSLPPVALHVIRLCQRDNFDVGDVARALGSDPGLSARIVSLVNSPLIAVKREVGNLSQVLVLLGVNAVRTLALGFSILGEVRAHERGALGRGFWRRALVAGTIAHDLARLEGLRHPEDAFLAGLLQDIGQLALEQAVFEVYQPMCQSAGPDHARLRALETQAFGGDHAEVGRWLLSQWRLPEIIRVAVGSSHDPGRWQRGTDPATEKTTLTVAVSGILADVWARPDTAAAARAAGAAVREMMGLDTDRTIALIKRVNRVLGHVAPLFEIEVGDADQLEELAAAAEQALRYPDAVVTSLPGAGSAAGSGKSGATPSSAPEQDALTGLATRKRFDAYLKEQFEFAKQVGKPLSVLLCDPDHLDMVNQTFGREAGDRALHALGVLVGERLRYRDLAARYGGEEFALVLIDTHAAGAAVVAERMRKKIEENQHDIGIGDPVRMSASIGCVTLDEDLTFLAPSDLLAALEKTLAEAKRAGRNRVVSFGKTT